MNTFCKSGGMESQTLLFMTIIHVRENRLHSTWYLVTSLTPKLIMADHERKQESISPLSNDVPRSEVAISIGDPCKASMIQLSVLPAARILMPLKSVILCAGLLPA